MSRDFHSRFSGDLNDMIDLKVSLGFSEKTYLGRAKQFDRFCAGSYPGCNRLMEPVIINWVKEIPDNDGGEIHRRLSFARMFGQYLKSVGKECYIVSDLFTAGRNVFIPYVFSDDELKALFYEIDRYERPGRPLEPAIVSTYFRLTYTCGLRPNEGRVLRRSEVDLNSGEVRIINTKWHKSRSIIMSDDMTAAARAYAAKRDVMFPDSEYFFPMPGGGPYTATWLGEKFRKFFALSKPDEPAELVPSVRVYDLRHRFATANLNRWLDQGIDLRARLPYLQAYMGHKDLDATAYYIHLLPENLVKSAGIDWDAMNRLVPRGELWEK